MNYKMNVKLICLCLITLMLIFSNFYFDSVNSIANFDKNDNMSEDFEPLSGTIPQKNSTIIDLNTGTDYLHHNITIYGRRGDAIGQRMESGDLNGDNLNDLIICNNGRVWVLYGNTTQSPIVDLGSEADIYIYKIGTACGHGLATGDVNGDGIDDLVMVAGDADGPGDNRNNCGEVYVIYGNESLPNTWNLSATSPNVTIYGRDPMDYIGSSIIGSSLAVGDINNDTIDDIIIGVSRGKGPNNNRVSQSWYCGEVYVIYGNTSLKSKIDLNTSQPDITIYGIEPRDNLGTALAVGDVNADGFNDLILGASGSVGYKNQKYFCGEVYVIYTNGSLPSVIDLLYSSANVTIYGDDAVDRFGAMIVSGDVNGDNIDDIVVSSTYGYGGDDSKYYCGEVYVFNGTNTTHPAIINASEAAMVVYGDYDGDHFGSALALGDTNGDNIDDIIVGASGGDGLSNDRESAGDAYVIFGSRNLSSKIDLFHQITTNITIYGAETHLGPWGVYYGDKAGTSVLISDINYDGKGDIIVGATGGDGRNNEKSDCGEVYIILSGGEILPIPVADSVELKNGAGDDDTICYAKNKIPYNFSVRIITPNNLDELDTVFLYLLYGSGSVLSFSWSETTKEFTEIQDLGNHVELSPKSSWSNNGKRRWTINFLLTFAWSFPDTELHNAWVQAVGDSGFTNWLNLTTGIYQVEYRLNFNGLIKVIDENQIEISEGGWVRGGSQITWGGLKVVYEGTTGIYPPSDTGLMVMVKNSIGEFWIKNNTQAMEISIQTPVVNKTSLNETFTLHITGIPAKCDVSSENFTLNVDMDRVTYSNAIPHSKQWQTTITPKCGIRITDPSTHVSHSSVQYRISKNDGIIWEDWLDEGMEFVQDESGVNCSVIPTFRDGSYNLIQWRAKDTMCNDYNESDPYRVLVDVSNVTFIDPSPSPDKWLNNLSVTCNITVIDNLSGVNASSIEYSTSTKGIWEYGDWQSARETVDGNIIPCSVTPKFTAGMENYIRWRAKDVMGNGYHVSDNYQIRIKLNHPPITTLKSPGDKTIIDTLSPELFWDSYDPDNDTTLNYNIYLSSKKAQIESFNTTAILKLNQKETQYKLTVPLTDGEAYYWTVIPNDGVAKGVCTSGIWQFKIDTSVEIPSVTLLTPSNNSNVTTTVPKLSWMLNYSQPNIVTYNIIISKSPTLENNFAKADLKQYKLTTVIVDPALTPGETYYWTVVPTANLVEGKLEGSCESGIWRFYVELPRENVYGVELVIEAKELKVVQGNYTTNNITIRNLGNKVDVINIQVNKGILDANIALEHSVSFIELNSSESRSLNLEIIISSDAAPKNYTVTITASSNGALSENKPVSVTKSFKLQVLEKAISEDEEDTGKEKATEEPAESNLSLWLVMALIIILILALFFYVYRVNKIRRVPYVKGELLYKPPEKVFLPGMGKGEEKELELATGEEEALALGAPASAQYQLPKITLTKAQKLDLLENRFLMGEVTEETYKDLKTKIESRKDITVDEEGEVEGEEPPETIEDIESKELEEVEEVLQETGEVETEEIPEPEGAIDDIEAQEAEEVETALGETDTGELVEKEVEPEKQKPESELQELKEETDEEPVKLTKKKGKVLKKKPLRLKKNPIL